MQVERESGNSDPEESETNNLVGINQVRERARSLNLWEPNPINTIHLNQVRETGDNLTDLNDSDYDNQPRLAFPGRGRGGAFSMFNKVMLGIMLVIQVTAISAHLPIQRVNSTEILGWDCSQPEFLELYDRSSFCDLGARPPNLGTRPPRSVWPRLYGSLTLMGGSVMPLKPSLHTSVGFGDTRRRSRPCTAERNDSHTRTMSHACKKGHFQNCVR